jgi:hypothetical protein
VSIITDLYAAPDPRYTTGFERAPLSRRAVAAALPAHSSSLPAFLPVLSGPTASRRYTGSTLLLGLIGNFRLPLSEIRTLQDRSPLRNAGQCDHAIVTRTGKSSSSIIPPGEIVPLPLAGHYH